MNEKTGQIDATKGGQPWNVPLTTVKLWPVRVMKGLFNRIKEMSPSLVDEPETVFDIEKAIAKLQEKLTKLKEGKDDPKGEPSGTTGSSA
jgi:hypothetical protein